MFEVFVGYFWLVNLLLGAKLKDLNTTFGRQCGGH